VCSALVAAPSGSATLPPAENYALAPRLTAFDLRCVDALVRVLGQNVAALSWDREARLPRAA